MYSDSVCRQRYQSLLDKYKSVNGHLLRWRKDISYYFIAHNELSSANGTDSVIVYHFETL